MIAAHRWLFWEVGTMRSLPWKAPANTCSSAGPPALDQALRVFDVLVYEEIQFAHDDERRGSLDRSSGLAGDA